MKQMMKRFVSVFLFLVIFCTAMTALAAEKDDFYSMNYVPIVGNNYVVDELNGVPAYYNQYDRYWQCLEYIKRYYKETFSVSISVNYKAAYVLNGDGTFEVAETPRIGDVVYWPSYLRRVNYGHVAIVKDYSDGVITLIEQNWRYNGKAAYERQITWPSSNYYVYTLTGTSADKVRGEQFGIWDLSVEHEAISVVSDWASESVNQAVEEQIIDTAAIRSYSDPITRLSFCNMNAELLEAVCPELSDIPLLSTGGSGGTPENESYVTREEAAVFITNTVGLAGVLPKTIEVDSILADYKDAYLISDHAREAMAVLIKLGIYMGTGDGMLNPKAYATTEQAITWLVRTHDVVSAAIEDGLIIQTE